MRRLEHCNIVKLMYFFYSSGDKVSVCTCVCVCLYISSVYVFKNFCCHPIYIFSFSHFY